MLFKPKGWGERYCPKGKVICFRIRTAGIQGIQGVIRKTVCDELRPDIWEQHHMDKIVPSLLYNMHCREGYVNGQGSTELRLTIYFSAHFAFLWVRVIRFSPLSFVDRDLYISCTGTC